MTTLQMLTLRRNTSLGRLATLEKRAERQGLAASPIVRSALQELASALDEVQGAAEQLQLQLDELRTLREELTAARQQLKAFIDVVPVACVWTVPSGEIDAANVAAAELLNVSASRLGGRPLVLFMTQREQFLERLHALDTGLADLVELDVAVRPRERRARRVRVIGRRIEGDARRCWFLTPLESAPAGT